MLKNKLKFIKGFGFELEGGWENSRYREIQALPIKRENGRVDPMMKSDGSVETDDTEAGEIASPVFTDIKDAWKFLREFYPEEVNHTCGFHIHVSLDEGYYVTLMEKDFHDKFLIWAEKLGKKYAKRLPKTYMSRVHGENSYCRKKFLAVEQSRGGGDRYTQLNYCYKDHKTLENRMFPGCKSANTAMFLLTQYLCFIEKYLAGTKLEAVKHSFEVICDLEEPTKKKIGEKVCA